MKGNKITYYSIEKATYKEVDKSDDNIYINFQLEVLININEGIPINKLN